MPIEALRGEKVKACRVSLGAPSPDPTANKNNLEKARSTMITGLASKTHAYTVRKMFSRNPAALSFLTPITTHQHAR